MTSGLRTHVFSSVWSRFVASLALLAAAPWTVQADPPSLKLQGASVVFRYARDDPYDRQNLYGFNHAPSVVSLPDGRLLAAWFSGPFEASVHQAILGAYSADGGRTWSSEEVLHDAPRRSDFDPAFIVDESRVWLFLTVGRWDRYPFVGLRDVERVEVGADSYKLYARSTSDSGRTWTDTMRVFDGVAWGCRSNGVKLKTGELLMPLYHFTSPKVGLLRSEDSGQNWTHDEAVSLPKAIGAGEPTLTQTASGRVLMFLRTRDGNLWSTVSGDRGTTWEEPTNTQMVAATSSHHVMTTKSGHVVLTHNPCPPPQRTPLTMRVSEDEGRTWGEPLVLSEVEPTRPGGRVFSRSVCYPSVAELPNGDLLAVWTQIEMDATRQAGVIHAARIALE